MPTSTVESRLSTLTFTDPQDDRVWSHVVVPAGSSGPAGVLPSAFRDLQVVVGAGRSHGLEEWVGETSSTSLRVLEEGSIIHEWYAEGLTADTLFLGASMTMSVLAHPLGRAVRAGALALTDVVIGHVHELAGTGYDGTTVHDALTMTSGVDWVEYHHRDPDSFASPAWTASRPAGTRAPCFAACARECRRAPAPATAPPARRCWTGARARHRALLRRWEPRPARLCRPAYRRRRGQNLPVALRRLPGRLPGARPSATSASPCCWRPPAPIRKTTKEHAP